MDVDRELAGIAAQTAGVVSLYLFGSFAEGRQHIESDVDLGVLLDRSVYPSASARFDIGLLLGTRLSDAARRRADIVILNDAPPLLARAVVTKGIRLFCRDTDADRDFVRDAQLLAADLEPWLRRMQAIKLEALGRRT